MCRSFALILKRQISRGKHCQSYFGSQHEKARAPSNLGREVTVAAKACMRHRQSKVVSLTSEATRPFVNLVSSYHGKVRPACTHMNYTDSQRDAIKTVNNNLQIIACAGSGKTQVISARVVEILRSKREQGVGPSNIVAFTFTDK